MIGILDLILRLSIWFLLTADLSLPNIIIGVSIALLLPRSATRPGAIRDWLITLWEVLVAIPQAYWEAIEIIISPHTREEVTMERVRPRRTPGLIFLDIFLITFTPKSIVLKYHERGWYEVHWVRRKQKRMRAAMSSSVDPMSQSERSGFSSSQGGIDGSEITHAKRLTGDFGD